MKKTLKRVLAVILVLVLSLTALAAVASAAPAAEKAESASVGSAIGSFFKKIANAIKGIIDRIVGGIRPEPKPEPDTTAPAEPNAPAEDSGFEFVQDSGKLEHVGDFH